MEISGPADGGGGAYAELEMARGPCGPPMPIPAGPYMDAKAEAERCDGKTSVVCWVATRTVSTLSRMGRLFRPSQAMLVLATSSYSQKA
jgi:hypothetical protein